MAKLRILPRGDILLRVTQARRMLPRGPPEERALTGELKGNRKHRHAVLLPLQMEEGPGAKECRKPPEVAKPRKWSPLEPPERTAASNSLTSARRPVMDFGL